MILRAITARHDKSMHDGKIQTASKETLGVVIYMRSELVKHVRSEKYTAGKDFSFPLALEVSASL